MFVGLLLSLLLTVKRTTDNESTTPKVVSKGYSLVVKHKIAGKHGAYFIRSKYPHGTVNWATTVYTMRQAKEWLECIEKGIDYEDMLAERKRAQQRRYRRNRREQAKRDCDAESLRVQAAEMGFHDFATDSNGNRTYFPSEYYPSYY